MVYDEALLFHEQGRAIGVAFSGPVTIKYDFGNMYSTEKSWGRQEGRKRGS